ncbi:serine/threonine-protein kinase [Actinomadura xylanilytica]|uniref:serine/threonine-protein kinase n=1 Tax=Actinomadura xylanilytica TaxID=887459 RepID=UPI00255ABC25|nr:serine/threonine-protein kinase [Actinomadura xylanilytica]MDL4772953.1 serine/threonine-protein kinase [Actinomadura xylanilytica]
MEPLQRSDPPTVGRYRLLGRLGAGGMGHVYLGRSPGGRPVAVKLINTSFASESAFRIRFRREAEAARRVGGFHTAQVVDADPDADPPWIVTAYIPGPSLRDAVQEQGPLPPASVLALGGGLAEGLSAVHACGLVHRDLKPANVIVAADGPRIIDFGIVRAVDASTVTTSGAMVGTPAYMSPEQARGDDVLGPASDVFSFGAVLAFAATGRSPFAAGSIAVAVYRILHQDPDLTGVPHSLRALVAQCLAKAPEERPSVAELIERLAPETGNEHWLPSGIAAMVTEHSASIPDAVSLPEALATSPDPAPAPDIRRDVHQPDNSPSAVPALPPSTLPVGPGSGGRARRHWVWPVAAFAAGALITVAGVVVVNRLTGPDSQVPQAGPAATATKPTSSVPAGYSLRKVSEVQLAVPSNHTRRQSTARCTAFDKPPGPLEEHISVCEGEGDMVPKEAAARADFWKRYFETKQPLIPITVTDVTVNSRPATQLTVFLKDDQDRVIRQQEMYYSSPEKLWKIVAVTEMEKLSTKADNSIFRIAIETFRA